MDSNRTRFHLVLGDDWLVVGRWLDRFGVARPLPRTNPTQRDQPFATTLDRDGACTLDPNTHLAPLMPGDAVADPALRTGAVIDRHGNIYMVSGAGIRRRPCADATGETWFWFPGNPEAPTGAETPLRGLALTAEGLLVAGRGGELLVFDLLVGGAPRIADLPGGLQVTDLSAAGSEVWGLDPIAAAVISIRLTPPPPSRELQPAAPTTADMFVPCDVTSAPALTVAFGPVRALPPGSLPIAIAALPDDDAVVLTADGTHTLWRVSVGSSVAGFETLAAIQEWAEVPRGHDLIALDDRVIVVDRVGNQAFEFRLDAAGATFLSTFVPLHGYRGHDLIAADGEARYLSATVNRWVAMVAMSRPRYGAGGQMVLPVREGHGQVEPGWDSGIPGCVWDRVVLDACVPSGVAIAVFARASDQRDLLLDDAAGATAWQGQPPLWRRPDGAELPHRHQLHAVPTDCFEVLLQRVRGRFLQLRLDVSTDLCSTPRLFALRAYFPRFSWLEHYLPANWREDRTAADFVERFLANPGGVFTAIEDRVAAAQLLLRPELLDPEYLPWLATWFDVVLDPAWDTRKRRFFLSQAMHFFARRGTVAGIRAAVRLLLEDCPSLQLFADVPAGVQVVEAFARRRRDAVLDADAALAGAAEASPVATSTVASTAHRFTVLLPTPDRELLLRDHEHAERLRARVRRVVEAEKPAHTVFDVVFADQWFRPGEALVGIDSMVGAPDRAGAPELILDRGVLGEAELAAPFPVSPPRDRDGRFLDPIPLVQP